MDQQIELLEKGLSNLSQKNQVFATSLITQYHKKGSLSDSQMLWVDKLVGFAKPPVKFSVPAIRELMLKARETLKRVRVVLATETGRQVVFKFPLDEQDTRILVTSKPRDGNRAELLGIISETGEYTSRGVVEVDDLVVAFNADPNQVTAEQGREFGFCCFCMRVLHDERSLKHGYGPTCAKRWGLVWE